jgi:predicted enzyme related to lactoylglutathione lyase
MNQGVQAVVYPVSDLNQSKAQFKALLGVEPYADAPYYVGFKVGNQDIGLDPNGHKWGATPYYQVEDVKETLQAVLDAGAELVQDVKDVGGGTLTAVVKDSNGSIIGLRQVPA